MKKQLFNLFLFPCLILSLFILSGCEKDLNPDTLIIRYGTSFGMCLGYCKQEIEVSNDAVKITKSGWQDSVKVKTCSNPNDRDKWAALVKSIDYKEFKKLKDVIGCPDCADGGAEWIEINTGTSRHKVVFEYGNEPSAVKDYINYLREYKAAFDYCK